MTSMKITKGEEKTDEVSPAEPVGPRYPYGLSINLDNDSLEKLGMDKLPEVGVVLTLTAKVKVTSASVNEYENNKERNVGLQITDMDLGKAKVEKDTAEELYGVQRDATKEGPTEYVSNL